MRNISLLSLSLLLAACGSVGTAQLIGDDPEDATSAKILHVTVTDEGCNPSAISLESDRKSILHFINVGGEHAVYSEDLALNITLIENEMRDAIIPTNRDGTFDLTCGVPSGAGIEGTITVGE